MINKAYLKACRTSGGDEVFTPFYAVEPLLKYIPKNKVIWCPCDEHWSAFVKLFNENGYEVINSSIKSGQNFLTYEPYTHYDVIITNLPFSKKDKMLERLDELKKPFAVLLPMNSLQGLKRFEVFKNGIQILAFDKRIDYHTNNDFEKFKKGNHFASAYFCRDILPKDLIIEELNKYDRPILKGEI